MVAGAAERRVWAKAARGYRTFPNLYVLLTAAPGIGKQTISLARRLMRQVREPGTNVHAFRLNPKQMTKAALVDSLSKAKQFKMTKIGNFTYHTLQIIAEEFQVLLPAYDTEYISALNEIFNNPDEYDEVRRTGSVKEIYIEHPQLNLLGGVQPSYFVSTFPENAWETGLARRIIMVYASETPFQDLFQDDSGGELEDTPEWTALAAQLGHLSAIAGQVGWEPDAVELLSKWHRGKCPPVPTHSKLVGYNNSRSMFAIKLSTISALARSGGLVVTELDVRRALSWLLGAEKGMPDVFREMIGRSDAKVIDELHYMMVIEQAKAQRPLGTAVLWEFLRQRVPSEKIEKIMLSAERSGVIFHPGGAADLWQAKPITEVRGVE